MPASQEEEQKILLLFIQALGSERVAYQETMRAVKTAAQTIGVSGIDTSIPKISILGLLSEMQFKIEGMERKMLEQFPGILALIRPDLATPPTTETYTGPDVAPAPAAPVAAAESEPAPWPKNLPRAQRRALASALRKVKKYKGALERKMTDQPEPAPDNLVEMFPGARKRGSDGMVSIIFPSDPGIEFIVRGAGALYVGNWPGGEEEWTMPGGEDAENCAATLVELHGFTDADSVKEDC